MIHERGGLFYKHFCIMVLIIKFQTLLSNVKDEFLGTAGYTLDKGIKKGFRGDAKELLRALARGNGHGVGKSVYTNDYNDYSNIWFLIRIL